MTAQYFAALAVDYQFTETEFVPVDDRARRRIEPNEGRDDILCFARFSLGGADLSIFRIREASRRTHAVSARNGGAANSVGGCHEAVLHRLWNEHEVTDGVSSGEDVGCGGLQVLIDFHEAALTELNACRSEVQPCSIGNPAHCDDRKRRLGTASLAVLR